MIQKFAPMCFLYRGLRILLVYFFGFICDIFYEVSKLKSEKMVIYIHIYFFGYE